MVNRYKNCYDILHKIYVDKTYVNQAIGGGSIAPIDTRIVYGVIEKNVRLEYVINSLAKVKDTGVKLVLKIGAYLLENIDSIPAYAIVNDCVDLVKSVGFRSASGLVNAVLKKISKGEYKLPPKSSKNYLSVMYSKPQWLIDELIENYGLDMTVKIISYDKPIRTSIRINRLKTNIDDFTRELKNNNIGFENTVLSNALYVDYSKLNNVKSLQGKYAVQGISSMLAVDALDLKSGNNVLDVCSAPGGKAVYMAEKVNTGKVTACDIYEHRLALISKYAETMGMSNIEVVLNDATIPNPKWVDKYDAVLCDVVCSGIGTMFSKPDVLLNKTLDDVKALNSIQYKILDTASQYVKNGGQLLYSTCSILSRENGGVVERFLRAHSEFKLDKITLPVECVGNVGYTLLPHLSDTDGFYIARMTKWTN